MLSEISQLNRTNAVLFHLYKGPCVGLIIETEKVGWWGPGAEGRRGGKVGV